MPGALHSNESENATAPIVGKSLLFMCDLLIIINHVHDGAATAGQHQRGAGLRITPGGTATVVMRLQFANNMRGAEIGTYLRCIVIWNGTLYWPALTVAL